MPVKQRIVNTEPSAENVCQPLCSNGTVCIAPQRVPSKMETWVPTAVASTAMHTVIGFRPLLSLPSQSLFLRTTLQKNRPGHEAFLPGGIEN